MQTSEYPMTWELFLREAFFQELTRRAMSGRAVILGFILILFYALRSHRYTFFFVLLLIVCFYFLLLHWLVRANRRYDRFTQLWGGAGWKRTVVFRRTSLVIREGRASSEVGYRHIVKIVEKEGEARLRFDDGDTVIIPTGSFTDGTWEEVRGKLAAEGAGR